jgi:hypothetical protein
MAKKNLEYLKIIEEEIETTIKKSSNVDPSLN